MRVVRDSTAGSGVVHEDVAPDEQARFTLTDEQLANLGALGRKVAAYYGDWPQDIEWAWADGTFYLLQSRDVTGVEFSWDEDLEDYIDEDRFGPDNILSRSFSDELWPGRITPLFYSVRSETTAQMLERSHELWGLDLTPRWGKYYKGEFYFNSELTYRWHVAMLPDKLRKPAYLMFAPPWWQANVEKEKPTSWLDIAKLLARIKHLDPDLGPYKCFTSANEQIENRAVEALGLPPEEIRKLSDPELKRYVNNTITTVSVWFADLWTTFFCYTPLVTAAVSWMLEKWYTGTNAMIFSDLITGLPRPTWVMKENLALWELGEEIRTSDELLTLFKQNRDGAFFDACEEVEEGREFLAAYREFLHLYGHRGHADRDAWYNRRVEDPSIDYMTFDILLAADGVVPNAAEGRLIAQRDEALAEVLECIKKQPLGSVKAEAFKMLHDWLLKFFLLRDDERFHSDRGTFAKKRAVQEVGRRLVERGVLDHDDDFWYLSKNELFRLLDGSTSNMRLVRAKVAARRHNCERKDAGELRTPMYVNGNGVAVADRSEVAGQSDDGILRGLGTSRGLVVGTARVIPSQKALQRVQKGDILVCFATDPGWTSVFFVAAGAIFETGGMLAHCSCISREYGIPAIQIPDAMRLIEDGSTIEVNGDTGEVRILAGPGEVVPESAAS